MEVNTFDAYVERRLTHWGEVFAFHRDAEILGYKSKDILQVLIEHKGEMPPKNIGVKPFYIDPLAWQVEEIISEMSKDMLIVSWVMRAYYSGSGRKNVERFELATKLSGIKLTLRTYHQYKAIGFNRVAGALSVLARAA